MKTEYKVLHLQPRIRQELGRLQERLELRRQGPYTLNEALGWALSLAHATLDRQELAAKDAGA